MVSVIQVLLVPWLVPGCRVWSFPCSHQPCNTSFFLLPSSFHGSYLAPCARVIPPRAGQAETAWGRDMGQANLVSQDPQAG